MSNPGDSPDFSKISTYSIKDRDSKVTIHDFAKPWKGKGGFASFLETLPAILAGNDINAVINAIFLASTLKKKVCFAMGAHVIKVGLNPVVNDLVRRGIINMIAMNGACIIHDLEIAMAGKTSEDVAQSLGNGSFGMARETSDFLNQAIHDASRKSQGLGRSVGELILSRNLPHKDLSLLATGVTHDIPITVHVAIGTDIIHMHPGFDAAACGKASHDDFKTFAAMIARLEEGVFINAGSAVILPEVFLKALTLARNVGFTPRNFTTVNLDFIRHYRPMTNVVNRPTLESGKGYSIVGHHEILIPLIAAGVIEKLETL